MVSAELAHNPYLLETTARFNNHAPKVNSAIERFEGRPLVDWANEIPQTYRDEMNGFDFDLYFTGTEADYERMVSAFVEQGIVVLEESSFDDGVPSAKGMPENAVRVIHDGGFEDVGTKRREIANLIEWLDSHRNRWFEYDEFINQNTESLDELVPYIIINKGSLQLDMPFVSVETVDSVQDLSGTELANTPVLFMVDPSNRERFRNELVDVKNRRDVEDRQLFFLIHPSLNQDQVVRVISDLGVKDPQVVVKPDDPIVSQYIDDYPSMDFVRGAIRVLREAFDATKGTLAEFAAESVKTTQSRGEEIAELDLEIEYHKRARRLIEETVAFNKQQEIDGLYQDFENRILSWRNRKTGATGHDDIQKAASEFVYDIRGWMSALDTDIVTVMQADKEWIDKTMTGLYYSAGITHDFDPGIKSPSFQHNINLPKLFDAFMSQTGTEKVAPKGDFFGLFGSGGKADAPEEEVEIASFDVWRFTARGMIMPIVRRVETTCKQELSEYHESLVKAYSQQLAVLAEQLIEDKKLATAMLSDAERLLEEDKDWLSEFENRLLTIERC